ncbi:chromosomal replication initiator protein DnaA [Spirochaetia bacterium 38H-sp]|uniref:Chromosomal replication initiator protein DnaA n=1 Tax=Rarispira pelagica TaxID=3141764 RepID=A0ABU9U989_9SPIR
MADTDYSYDYKIIWDAVTSKIKDPNEDLISTEEYNLWFSQLEYHTGKENTIILSVPSAFIKDQIIQRYKKIIETEIEKILGKKLSLDFEIRQKNKEEKIEEKIIKLPERRRTLLKKDYTFDNFVIGENNAFAANACIAIANNPGKSYNPCLIYGGVGLGKTHLLQSIGNKVHDTFEDYKIVYVTAENFTNEFIQAIQNRETEKFKRKYRTVDVLLIDDIHFFVNKTETQEELFHTFNALYDSEKQMVFTCDRPVSELKNISDRLRSRFERGLNVDLQPPSFETRCAILKRKVIQRGKQVSDEVINIIAEKITTNVRDLEAALIKVIAYSELVKKQVTKEIAESLLSDMSKNVSDKKNITIETIQEKVANYFNIKQNDLRNKKRTRTISFPRQIAMYISRELTEFSTTEIGEAFGGRDHTTVMYAIQKIESKMKTDPTLHKITEHLIKEIKGE